MRHINFVESPGARGPDDKPVFAVTAGQRWDSVFIEVSVGTYLSERFTRWVADSIFPRLHQSGSIRIAIFT